MAGGDGLGGPPQSGCFAFTPLFLAVTPLLQGAGPAQKKNTAFSNAGRQSPCLQYTSTGRNSSFSISLHLHIRELVSFFPPQTHRGWFFCNKSGRKKRPLFIYFPMERCQLVLVNNAILQQGDNILRGDSLSVA